MKDAELPQGIAMVEGMKAGDFSAAAATTALRVFASTELNGSKEWVLQVGNASATADGSGFVYVNFPKAFPVKCVAVAPFDNYGAAMWGYGPTGFTMFKVAPGTPVGLCYIAVGY